MHTEQSPASDWFDDVPKAPNGPINDAELKQIAKRPRPTAAVEQAPAAPKTESDAGSALVFELRKDFAAVDEAFKLRMIELVLGNHIDAGLLEKAMDNRLWIAFKTDLVSKKSATEIFEALRERLNVNRKVWESKGADGEVEF